MQEKKLKEKLVKIYTSIIIFVSMFVFELGYCNAEFFKNLITKEVNAVYNFSLCRIVIYAIVLIVYFVFRKKILEDAIEVSTNKYKRILVYISSITAIIILCGAAGVCAIKPDLTRGISIGILTVLMGNLAIIYLSNNYIKNVIVILSTLGIVFSIATNFNHALDEKKHFMTSFNVAFLSFDYEANPITDKKIEELPQLSKFTTINPFLKGTYKPELSHDVDTDDTPSIPTGYSALLYIPSALGILLGVVLRGSIIDIYILGRIFNLITYGALICVALKILPFKKGIFFTIFMMPMLLMLAATYSIDGLCVGLISIFVAYCFKIYYEKQAVTIKDFIILLALFIISLISKSMAYAFVGFIIFILPIKNTLKMYKKFVPIMIALTLILVVVGSLLVVHIIQTRISEGDQRAVGNISPNEQMKFMISHPLSCIKLGINHVEDTLLNYNWYVALHNPGFFTANATYVMLPLMLYVFYIAILDDDVNLNLKTKIILILTFMLTFVTTSLPLYLTFSEIGAMHISGYQARYIFPILPILLCCVSNKRLKSTDNKNRKMNIAIMSSAIIVIGLTQLILV